MKKPASRMQTIPPYLFARIEQKIAEKRAQGIDVISLGIGDPDLPTPDFIIKELQQQSQVPANHQYPSSQGMMSFREAVAEYYQARFGVELNPRDEVCSLLGEKEGIANMCYCYIDRGDINLVPDPAYPVYAIGANFAGGENYYLPLKPERNFLPDLEAIPPAVLAKAKILWLNYPNNPTGAVTDLAFFEQAVAFARRHELLLCHDTAYAEMTYDGYRAPSILEIPGAKEVAVEFGSCSKPFNMTGWRVGFCVGNAEAVGMLARYKSNVDSGIFQAIQYAGIAGLKNYLAVVEESRAIYAARRDILVGGLNKLGWQLAYPKGTFYVWAPVPRGYTSESFAEKVLEDAAVVITPGSGYGVAGEGYFRATLTVEEDRMGEAMSRLEKALGKVDF